MGSPCWPESLKQCPNIDCETVTKTGLSCVCWQWRWHSFGSFFEAPYHDTTPVKKTYMSVPKPLHVKSKNTYRTFKQISYWHMFYCMALLINITNETDIVSNYISNYLSSAGGHGKSKQCLHMGLWATRYRDKWCYPTTPWLGGSAGRINLIEVMFNRTVMFLHFTYFHTRNRSTW